MKIKLLLIWTGIILILMTLLYLAYPYLEAINMGGFTIPNECWANYPFNVTTNSEIVYTRFYSNKCCSIDFLPPTLGDLYMDNYNGCWNKSIGDSNG